MKRFEIEEFSIERPRPNEAIYDESISIVGWFVLTDRTGPLPHVRALLDDVCIGETHFLAAPRAGNVPASQKENALHYRLLVRLPDVIAAPRNAVIEIVARWNEDDAQLKIGEVHVRLLPARLKELPYGEIVFPQREELLHRENIYGWGPPSEQPSHQMLQLLLGYLPPHSSVVDVGCGAGAYGPGLIAAGHRWLGLESNSYCWEVLARRQLPFRKIEELNVLPCAAAEFDNAICIEVLEHVHEPDNFLREIARVIRGRAFFSVPNIEVIPYFTSWEVVPWHLLESEHRNFFTRGNLAKLLQRHFRRVEVFSCGEHSLQTRDGISLHVHLFGVAET
jgi:SAM-dependent methyltransferase